ncbi:unnamed protein product [Meloidogyne enterolobii]|uniref:Uncharacterized protein n=1 Tax=Meloidogyne enterolobii TaxID=390850 RepID=A0ACB0YY73_MELEN
MSSLITFTVSLCGAKISLLMSSFGFERAWPLSVTKFINSWREPTIFLLSISTSLFNSPFPIFRSQSVN